MSEKTETQCKAVPLVELLESIPRDAVYRWTDTDGLKAFHNLPIGRYAHEAAALLRTPTDGWRDISTAPKGGGADNVNDPAWVEPPLILLRFPNAPRGEKCSIARWDWYYAEGGGGYDARYGIHGAWTEPLSGERVLLHYDPPTHWLPINALPPPPTGAGEK